jgi:predicted HTH transcriptional regulator
MALFTPDEIARIVAEGEGRQIELKEGVAADGRIARTLCAFANTRGGVLLVGVSDRGRILGVSRPAVTIGLVRDLAERAVAPPVAVRLEAVRVGPARVVCCSTPLSARRPHAVAADGQVLVRVGASNRAAPESAVAALGTTESRRATAPAPFDALVLREVGRRTAVGAAIEDVARALDAGKQRTRQAFESLERAGLLVAHGLGARRIYWPA